MACVPVCSALSHATEEVQGQEALCSVMHIYISFSDWCMVRHFVPESMSCSGLCTGAAWKATLMGDGWSVSHHNNPRASPSATVTLHYLRTIFHSSHLTYTRCAVTFYWRIHSIKSPTLSRVSIPDLLFHSTSSSKTNNDRWSSQH